ncbi:helix-hairpin-helix domain-containing protein [Aquabacterium humicola]|uniref:helix-hairpin-helix domain-containing protein n=1 Tax=Aquabacterium humicola TaxID=3237377 RepID=UPI00254351D3|nr:helix-hairpin-helix domain-containing protein [Rubrivivax pictus]
MNEIASAPFNPSIAAENARIAEALREAATLLAAQRANPFRVGAYREAARTVDAQRDGVRATFDRGGRAALDALPAIGPGIAGAIAEMLVTGRWRQLERWRGETDAAHLFQVVPGIGAELSERIHDELHIDTLEALEAAAFDGRLAAVRGIGPRRARAIGAVLAQMLDRGPPRAAPQASAPGRGDAASTSSAPSTDRAVPPVDLLLELDAEYRAQAAAGRLPTIAPRRFNPRGEAWLPVWHVERDGWHFTLLFSNTARAHELHRERDWVVIYFHGADHFERQHTIVTETRGSLEGLRVVRGRELECRDRYAPHHG